jgi:hypothetical protein
VKALRAELGEDRADAIVRKALGGLFRGLGEKWWRTQGARNLGEKMASAFARHCDFRYALKERGERPETAPP